MFLQELIGKKLGLDNLKTLTFIPYGHFTSMQVRNNRVKGLDSHIQRLRESTRTLFGIDMSGEKIKDYVSHIREENHPDITIRVNIFSRSLNIEEIKKSDLQVLITSSDPIYPVTSSVFVQTKVYIRIIPEIKHVGIALGLLSFQKEIPINTNHDIVYADKEGNIAESSTWNIGFYNGEKVILPNNTFLGRHNNRSNNYSSKNRRLEN